VAERQQGRDLLRIGRPQQELRAAARGAPGLGDVRSDPLAIDGPAARSDPPLDLVEEALRQRGRRTGGSALAGRGHGPYLRAGSADRNGAARPN
jgi:hypothetical protein